MHSVNKFCIRLPCAKVTRGNGTRTTLASTTSALQKNQGTHSYVCAEKIKAIANSSTLQPTLVFILYHKVYIG